jgi:hypothetical protein
MIIAGAISPPIFVLFARCSSRSFIAWASHLKGLLDWKLGLLICSWTHPFAQSQRSLSPEVS